MFAWDDYPRYRISPSVPSDLRHADVVNHIDSFQATIPGRLHVKLLGESVEGRSISMLTLGDGPKTVLAWSQMHGNEPTHTAALLDLVNFLLEDPEHPSAGAILTGCKLHFLVMLNPDGAKRWTRRNAQDIDVNRDAIHLQSPEGRILRDAVEALQPDFALNLHNQRPRTAVDQALQVAALSLLVPPIDAEESDADNVVCAKRLAGYMAKLVEPYCPGPVSRYDAEFMPRCFGEWVQQRGAATITLEAGGWSTVDAEPLVQLHFVALVACLEAIATDSFLQVAPDVYESLPRTGIHDLFGHLIRDVLVLNGLGHPPFRADLGINFEQPVTTKRCGTIEDLGDLRITSGKTVTAEANLVCLPGRIVWLPNVTPRQLPDEQTIDALLAKGVTTILGQLDLESVDDVKAFSKLPSHLSLPINLGFVAKLTHWSPETRDHLLEANAHGLLGIITAELPTEAERLLEWFQLPLAHEHIFPSVGSFPELLAECAAQTYQCAQATGLLHRGLIRLGVAADIALFQTSQSPPKVATRLNADLHQVLVGGNVVFDRGNVTGEAPGVLLTRRGRF